MRITKIMSSGKPVKATSAQPKPDYRVRMLADALKMALDLLDTSDTRYYFTQQGEQSAVNTAIRLGRQALLHAEG